MRATIDKAGRVVIPVEIRRRTGLKAGTELEVTQEGFAVRLEPAVSPPKVVRRKGRLVVVPTVPEDEREQVDLAALIEQERDRWPL